MPETKTPCTPHRARLRAILDGDDVQFGRWVVLMLHGLILIASLAFAMGTMPGLPQDVLTSLRVIETTAVVIFLVEYLLRIYAAPHRLRYVFSFWGIIDFLAWAPLIAFSIGGVASLRILRLLQSLRILKLVGFSKALARLGHAFSQIKTELALFAFIAIFLLYVSSVGIYLFENAVQPDKFPSVPASFWWSIVTLTTVGYGDIVPITLGGKIFTSMILLLGLGVFAVPAGVITSALIGREIEEIEESLEKIESNEEKSRKKQMPLPKRGA